jgi:hypothetical protein
VEFAPERALGKILKERNSSDRIFDVAQVLHQEVGPGEIHFPETLNEWTEEAELARMVREASAGGSGKSGGFRLGEGECRTPSLLYLLVYSYCRGIYGSEDIIRSFAETESDELIDGPEVQEARHFRRSHRRELQECLSHVLQQVWQMHMGRGPVTDTLERNQTVDGFGLHQDMHPFESEAKLRIDRAVQYDCWACDW